jgi:hypothetical protein
MDKSTLLHRQVHPSFVQENKISFQVFENIPSTELQITSSVFSPTPKDENKLSVYNGNKYSPEQSFNHYLQSYKSVGVVSVTVEECENTSLICKEDNNPFDGHSYIDFQTLAGNSVKAKAKILKALATKRGWQFKNT